MDSWSLRVVSDMPDPGLAKVQCRGRTFYLLLEWMIVCQITRSLLRIVSFLLVTRSFVEFGKAKIIILERFRVDSTSSST